MTNFYECPNLECQAQWGFEEISFQQCDCCGWPYPEDEMEQDYYEEE